MPAVAPVDSLGAAITVGAAVKLLGTVTAINIFDNRYAEVTVLLTNPISVPDVVVAAGAQKTVPGGAVKSISIAPTMLTLGV